MAFAPEFGSRKSKEQREAERSGPGWVYVLKQPRDPYFSNMYFKVGLSKKDPDERAIQLWGTARPDPSCRSGRAFLVEGP